MGEKLRPSRHSRFNKPRCLVITLLFNTVYPWGSCPDFGQLYWRLQCCRSLSRAKSRLPQHRKQWRTPLPKIPTCHKELSLDTPKDCRYSHTIYRHAKQPSYCPYVTCHPVLPHAYLFVFVRVFVFMACPATVSTPSPPAILISYLSCGYKLPRKAAPAASRQPKLRPCSQTATAWVNVAAGHLQTLLVPPNFTPSVFSAPLCVNGLALRIMPSTPLNIRL